MHKVYIDEEVFEVKEKKVFGQGTKLIIGNDELEVEIGDNRVHLDVNDAITITTLED